MAETSTHLESASVTNSGAAARLLVSESWMVAPLQSETIGRCRMVPMAGRQALCTGVPAAETSTHLEFASASNNGAAATSLLDQSES